jgi:hypothetical protein
MANCDCKENCSCKDSMENCNPCCGCLANTLIKAGLEALNSQTAFMNGLQAKLKDAPDVTQKGILKLASISESNFAYMVEIYDGMLSLFETVCTDCEEDEELFAICPYCGEEVDIDEDEFGFIECPHCEEEFEVVDEESFLYYFPCPNCKEELQIYDGEEDKNGCVECCTCHEKILVGN